MPWIPLSWNAFIPSSIDMELRGISSEKCWMQINRIFSPMLIMIFARINKKMDDYYRALSARTPTIKTLIVACDEWITHSVMTQGSYLNNRIFDSPRIRRCPHFQHKSWVKSPIECFLIRTFRMISAQNPTDWVVRVFPSQNSDLSETARVLAVSILALAKIARIEQIGKLWKMVSMVLVISYLWSI